MITLVDLPNDHAALVGRLSMSRRLRKSHERAPLVATQAVKPIALTEKSSVKPHLAQTSGRNSVVGPRPASAPMGLTFSGSTRMSLSLRSMLVPLHAGHFSDPQRSLIH